MSSQNGNEYYKHISAPGVKSAFAPAKCCPPVSTMQSLLENLQQEIEQLKIRVSQLENTPAAIG